MLFGLLVGFWAIGAIGAIGCAVWALVEGRRRWVRPLVDSGRTHRRRARRRIYRRHHPPRKLRRAARAWAKCRMCYGHGQCRELDFDGCSERVYRCDECGGWWRVVVS